MYDQASNWLERLPAGSITTWEDLTTRFLAQFFPPGRTAKLRNDILMFQQHHGESLSEAWTRFKDLLQKVPHHGIDLWLQLHDLNAEESWAILEDLALYNNESWNDPRDFAKPVKAIALPQDVPSTSDRRLIELENQVQRLMEAHLAPTQPTQVNKITTSCHHRSISKSLPRDTVKNPKLSTSLILSARSYPTKELQCLTHIHGSINTITIHPKQQNDSRVSIAEEKEQEIEGDPKDTNTIAYIEEQRDMSLLERKDITAVGNLGSNKDDEGIEWLDVEEPLDLVDTIEESVYELLIKEMPKCSLNYDFRIKKGDPRILKIPCMIGHKFTANAYIDVDLPMNIMMAKIAVGEGITRSVFGVKGVDLGEEEAPYWTTLGKRESYKPRPSSDGVGAQIPYYARKDFLLDCHLPREWEIARDAELNPFKDTLVFRRMVEFLGAIPINLKSNMWESDDLIKKPINWDKPPKNEDGAWHAKIKLIDPDGEEFTKTLQSIPTTKMLSERESPREIIDLDHFYDT
ncbi:MAK10-like protein [Tanacetum coccineum]